MEDYEVRWQRPSATPRRDFRASSASRDYRESSASRDYRAASTRDARESSVLTSSMTSRNIRATSVLPASLKHYEDLAEADEDYIAGTGYINRGLHQAKRAISEAKEILRGSSLPRESVSRYNMSSSSYDKKSSSRMEDIREFESEVLRERRENKALRDMGTYKITVTPQTDYWSTRIPARLYTRSTVAALLAAYSPRNFPDFIFGRYGGSTLHKPVSATTDYYDASNYSSNLLDSSSYDLDTKAQDSYSKSYNRSAYDSSSKNYAYDRASVGAYERELREGSRRRSFEDEAQLGSKQRQSSYDYLNNRENISRDLKDLYSSSKYNYNYDLMNSTENSSNVIKDKRKSKYYHYYIPRHYPGTPMRGGYLVNAGRDYGWKY